ncbi:MAG: hypothetical protein JW982_03660 [Spirochaetes bacterium]|nr:hypothetical protein [Spirochaetota bacterium]
MKKSLIWSVAVILIYGGLFLATHLYLGNNPHKVTVIVDTSYEMANYEKMIHLKMLEIFSFRYSVFSLYTDKSAVYDWTRSPNTGRNLKFYGPDNFENLLSGPLKSQLEKSEKIFFLSNSKNAFQIKKAYKNVTIINF